MNEKEYMLLYEKYISDLCNEEEKQILYQYQDNFKLIGDDENTISDGMSEQKDRIYNSIMVSLGGSKRHRTAMFIPIISMTTWAGWPYHLFGPMMQPKMKPISKPPTSFGKI